MLVRHVLFQLSYASMPHFRSSASLSRNRRMLLYTINPDLSSTNFENPQVFSGSSGIDRKRQKKDEKRGLPGAAGSVFRMVFFRKRPRGRKIFFLGAFRTPPGLPAPFFAVSSHMYQGVRRRDLRLRFFARFPAAASHSFSNVRRSICAALTEAPEKFCGGFGAAAKEKCRCADTEGRVSSDNPSEDGRKTVFFCRRQKNAISLLTNRKRCAIIHDCRRSKAPRIKRGVAQFGRALGSGPRGRRFKSSHSDHVVASFVSLATTFLCVASKSHLSLTPLLLLSKSNPLRWASIW